MATRIQTLNSETTTGEAKDLFNAVNDKLGFIPNLIKVFGNSPATLKGYLSLSELTSGGTFSNKFREQLALVIAQENACDYCLSAHTAIGKMNGLNEEQIANARQGVALNDKETAGLVFAKHLVANKAIVDTASLQAVKDAGFNDGEILEIVLNVVFNLLTNYTNHLAETEIDFPVVTAAELV